MAALIDATTGYGTVADFTNTTPGYGTSSTGSDVGVYGFTPWVSHVLIDGVMWNIGGPTGTTKEAWGVIGV